MDFKYWNNILGWGAFTIALVSYYLTLEQYVPLWDCGEYISTAYKLEVGHPPGAPTFNMIGAFFTYFLPKESVAFMINLISALCSAFTILFMFWTITYLGKRLASISGELTEDKKIAVLGSSLIGALAYAFTDSFWFSAVEGEVYAMSSFFTALVVWAIFKWDEVADEPHADRWLIFIMYMIGLSIGVHLLNLLAIPAVGMMYYFRRYNPSTKGGIIAFVVSIIILGIIQAIIIPGMAKWPAKMELLFVNDFGLPFSFGAVFFFGLVIGLIVYLIRYSIRKQKHLLSMAVNSFAVILIGFSSFAMIMIRSQANTPVDENNPETFPQLLSYFNRDQYGSAPLVSGNYWNSETTGQPEDGDPIYMYGYSVKRGDRFVRGFRTEEEAKAYVKANDLGTVNIVAEYFVGDNRKGIEPVFKPAHTTIFPRMYSREDRHIRMYKHWSDYKGGEYITSLKTEYDTINKILNQISEMRQKGSQDPQLAEAERYYNGMKDRLEMNGLKLPTFGENLTFFFNYQMGWMYWRYFLWNFVGRQSDEQNINGNIIDGNWYSGVGFIDSERLGDQENIPSVIKNNKAHNTFFFLPLILGLIGMIYHLLKAPKDWLIILLMFIFTGMAIIVYLNSKPAEPRERDYAYAGSFFAFAFWIGLGVYALFDMVKNVNWKQFQKAGLMALGFGVLLYAIELFSSGRHGFSYSVLYMSLVAFGAIALMIYAGNKMKKSVHAAYLAIALCLSVPTVMAYQGWDDHNRSGRSTARSFAKNFMRSCDKNAIMFTYGDNDTFPLWYIQEVEDYRTDSRVVNTSLLGTDWYIDQMMRKAYLSEPVPFTIPEYIFRQGGSIDQFELDDSESQNVVLDLKAELDKQKDNPRKSKRYSAEWVILDGKSFFIKVNKENAIKSGIVPKGMEDQVVDRIEFRIQDNVLMKSDFMILDLLANYDWKRPIYFATGNSSKEYLGLDNYFVQEGLAYKLVPIPQQGSRYSLGGMNIEKTYAMLMGTSKNPDDNFEYGGMDAPDANVDFYVRRTICASYHTVFMALTGALIDEPAMLDEQITQKEFEIRVIQDSIAANADSSQLKNRMNSLNAELKTLRERKNKYDYHDMAKKVINRCFEVMPPENVPYDTYTQFFVELLFLAGDKPNGIKHLKGHVEQAKEMMIYLCKMEPDFATNDVISKVAENYEMINQMFSLATEANTTKELDDYILKTETEVYGLMKKWIDEVSKADREKGGYIKLTMPRYFTHDAEIALDVILNKDINEGIKQINEAGGHFQTIATYAMYVLNNSSDNNTMADMQRLMQRTQGQVGRWLKQILAMDPSKQKEIMAAFPDLFGGPAAQPTDMGGGM